MSEVMTLAEIKSRFDCEWILLEDPETTPGLEVRGGRVLWHSKNRDEVYRKARELAPRRSAFLFTGKIPEGSAIIL